MDIEIVDVEYIEVTSKRKIFVIIVDTVIYRAFLSRDEAIKTMEEMRSYAKYIDSTIMIDETELWD